MADDTQARPGTAAFAAALDVRRNALAGFGLGGLFAGGVFVLFVGLPGSRRSPLLFVGLAAVLAVGTGLLLTVVFTLASAYRLARQP